MLRIGCIILTIWGGLHFIASVISLVASIMGKYAPMMKMVFTDDEIATFDNKILGITKSLGIMHNSEATIFAILVLLITWFGLNNGQKWSFWTLLFVGIFTHATWFLSDILIGNKTMLVNVVLSIIFIVGIYLSWLGLFKGKKMPNNAISADR